MGRKKKLKMELIILLMHAFLSSFQVKQHHHTIGEAPLTSPERLRPCSAHSEGRAGKEERREGKVTVDKGGGLCYN